MTIAEATHDFMRELLKHESLSVYKAATYCGVPDWPSFETAVRAQIEGAAVALRDHESTNQAVGDAIGVAMLLGAHLERLGLMRRVT